MENNNKTTVPLGVFNFFLVVFFILGIAITITYFYISDTKTDTNDIPLPVFKYNESMNYDIVSISVGVSMNPTITEGSKVVCVFDFDETKINIGDIIVFETDKSLHKNYEPQNELPSFMCHRVVDIKIEDDKTLFITKGDNNPPVDEERTTIEEVVCVVVGVLYMNDKVNVSKF